VGYTPLHWAAGKGHDKVVAVSDYTHTRVGGAGG
jgi:hypothetical protein